MSGGEISVQFSVNTIIILLNIADTLNALKVTKLFAKFKF